jgi:hypothetical protein
MAKDLRMLNIPVCSPWPTRLFIIFQRGQQFGCQKDQNGLAIPNLDSRQVGLIIVYPLNENHG